MWRIQRTYPQDTALLDLCWAKPRAVKHFVHAVKSLDPDHKLPSNMTGKVPRTGAQALGDETGNVVMVTQSGTGCHSRPRDCKRGVRANIHWVNPGKEAPHFDPRARRPAIH